VTAPAKALAGACAKTSCRRQTLWPTELAPVHGQRKVIRITEAGLQIAFLIFLYILLHQLNLVFFFQALEYAGFVINDSFAFVERKLRIKPTAGEMAGRTIFYEYGFYLGFEIYRIIWAASNFF
jgi:hypothetical protein